MHVINVWHHDSRRVALLVKEGTRHDHYIVFDSAGLRIHRCPADDDTFYEIIDYPPIKAATRLLAFGRKVGMTLEARRLLESAA
jgi:hypothetical protein